GVAVHRQRILPNVIGDQLRAAGDGGVAGAGDVTDVAITAAGDLEAAGDGVVDDVDMVGAIAERIDGAVVVEGRARIDLNRRARADRDRPAVALEVERPARRQRAGNDLQRPAPRAVALRVDQPPGSG